MHLVSAPRLLVRLPVVDERLELGPAGVAHTAANASVHVLRVVVKEMIVLTVEHQKIGTLAAIVVLDEVVFIVIIVVERHVSDVREVDIATGLLGKPLACIVSIVRQAHWVVEASDV